MARLNILKLGGLAPGAALTHENTPVRAISAEQELRRAVLACMLWEDQFYESGIAIAGRIRELVPKVEASGVAALAVEARTNMKLRHVPLLLVREMARLITHRALVADTLTSVIQRADELAEFVAIYWSDGRAPLSGQVKKGLAAAFTKFDEYALAKYNRPGPIKLRDVLFLSHAKPLDEKQAETWKRLIDGALASPDTWEVALSGGADKRSTFERLIDERKLGPLALLRNLRNMQAVGVSDKVLKEALRTMKTDRVLPFRFIAAARYAPKLEPELELAMFRSVESVERLRGRTALVIDTSPSMWGTRVSARSEMDRFESAAALAILLREVSQDVNIYAFNERAYVVPPRRGFALRDALAKTQGNWSRGGLAVDLANREGYDRIIVLTDGQWHYSSPAGTGYNEAMAEAQVICPAPRSEKAYMINVASYKNGVGYGRWLSIDGWSEAIVEYIRAMESANIN
jgi:60 kDa SS-A/Ro ribonucleoprotein